MLYVQYMFRACGFVSVLCSNMESHLNRTGTVEMQIYVPHDGLHENT